MIIYTSYFAKVKDLPENIIPISIANKDPKGTNFKKLQIFVPGDWLWDWKKKYKGNEETSAAIGEYRDKYRKQVFSSADNTRIKEIISEILSENPGKEICLLCYENPTKFCHRHFAAGILTDMGYACEEYGLF